MKINYPKNILSFSLMSAMLLSMLTFPAQPRAQTPKPTPPKTTTSPAAAAVAVAASLVDNADEDTPRFLLQVGIDNYKSDKIRDLKGCLDDVKDLAAVLDERFSSAKQKWQKVQLFDAKATRVEILSQFQKHLIDNAAKYKNAIVVFHFSGHGSQIKDVNNDEPDGWDETLVTYDSSREGDNGFDITDDEINVLFKKLSEHTANITFILDSCNSGTATRGDDYARVMEADKRTPKTSKKQTVADAGGARGDVKNADMLSENEKYVTIAAALSGRPAFPVLLNIDGKEKWNGALTYNLVLALRSATAETTYRDLMNTVAPAVSRMKPQEPQIEGNIGRKLFGGSAKSEEPYIKISKIVGTKIFLEAGQAHGLKENTPLAIYSEFKKDAPQLKGETGKLANATVTNQIGAVTAVAVLPAANPQITTAARVVILSPNFGTEPLRILDESASNAGANRTATASGLPKDLGEKLQKQNIVQIVAPAAPNSAVSSSATFASIKRGKYGEVFKQIDDVYFARTGTRLEVCGSAEHQEQIDNTPLGKTAPKCVPAADEEVFYFDSGIGRTDENGSISKDKDGKPLPNPMYAVYVPTKREDAGELLKEQLEIFAAQRNLRTMSNNLVDASLKDKLKITVITGKDFVIDPQTRKTSLTDGVEINDKTRDFQVEQGTLFQIKIENTSRFPLFVTLFDLNTQGEIKIIYPPAGSREALKPNGDPIITNVYRITGPAGAEMFKVLATTEPSDFSMMVTRNPDITQRKGEGSPIDWLLSKALVSRDAEEVADTTSVNSWLTADVNFQVNNKIVK